MTDHQQTIFLFGALAILIPAAYVAAIAFLAELKALRPNGGKGDGHERD